MMVAVIRAKYVAAKHNVNQGEFGLIFCWAGRDPDPSACTLPYAARI